MFCLGWSGQKKWVCILLLAGGGARPAAAQATPDATIETTQRLLRKAVSAAQEPPSAATADAGLIISALQSTRDKELLPIFDKLRRSKSPDAEIYGMISEAVLAKQSGGAAVPVDLKLLLSSKDNALIGRGLATLMDADLLNDADLKQLAIDAPDAGLKAMAVLELDKQHKLDNRALLTQMLKEQDNTLRYYGATAMLASKDPAEVSQALGVLKEMTDEHNYREAVAQAMMLERMRKEKLVAGLPWAAQIARDDKFDDGLRYTAVNTLLALSAPEGPQILGAMIQQQHDVIQQVKLGLIAIEHPAQLTPAILEPLLQSKSRLVKVIGMLAQKAVGRGDVTPDLLQLMKEGDPIILDWALVYSEDADQEAQVAIRAALVQQSTIVDNVRDQDYKRAAVAAERLLSDDGEAGRSTIRGLLKSDNRAVVEATLAGLYNATGKDESELVLPIWTGLTRTTSTEKAANFAALILAREGHTEPLNWLPGMVVGGTAQGPGARALAGWYYAKLKGQAASLVKAVIAD